MMGHWKGTYEDDAFHAGQEHIGMELMRGVFVLLRKTKVMSRLCDRIHQLEMQCLHKHIRTRR